MVEYSRANIRLFSHEQHPVLMKMAIEDAMEIKPILYLSKEAAHTKSLTLAILSSC